MIVLKTKKEIAPMLEACKISAQALQVGGEAVKAGVSTREIDKKIHQFIRSQGAVPSFLGYGGFPGSACISVNEELIHGIPDSRVLKDGDIVSIDVGAFYKGYHGDNAYTFAVGKISDEAQTLLDVTKESLNLAIAAAVPGGRLGDVSYAVQSYVEEHGFAIVKQFVGHGVGEKLHEAPEVPNYGTKGRGVRLIPGMTLAIEPMVNAVGEGVKTLANKWTVVPVSGSLSAHFEHTILITDQGPVIMTLA